MSAPPEPQLRVVVDETDDGGLSAELSRRCGIGSGVVLLRPIPDISKLRLLAADLLVALGKRHDALTRERYPDPAVAWHLAALWLRAERARHLIVVGADRLERTLREDLRSLVPDLGLMLTFVVTGAPSLWRGPVLRDATPCTPRALLRALPRSSPAAVPAPEALARSVVTPACACALAVAHLTTIPVSDLTDLTVGNLNPEGDDVVLGGQRWPVPTALAGPIRAQVLARAAEGADTDAPLFINHVWQQATEDELTTWVEEAIARGRSPRLERPFPYTVAGRRLTIVGSVRTVRRPRIGLQPR